MENLRLLLARLVSREGVALLGWAGLTLLWLHWKGPAQLMSYYMLAVVTAALALLALGVALTAVLRGRWLAATGLISGVVTLAWMTLDVQSAHFPPLYGWVVSLAVSATIVLVAVGRGQLVLVNTPDGPKRVPEMAALRSHRRFGSRDVLEGGIQLLEQESGHPVSEYERAVFEAHPEMLDRTLVRVLEAKKCSVSPDRTNRSPC